MRRSPLNYEKKQTKVKVLSFDLTNVIFATCFTLRGHDTHIDFLWVLFLVGRIGPLIQN